MQAEETAVFGDKNRTHCGLNLSLTHKKYDSQKKCCSRYGNYLFPDYLLHFSPLFSRLASGRIIGVRITYGKRHCSAVETINFEIKVKQCTDCVTNKSAIASIMSTIHK